MEDYKEKYEAALSRASHIKDYNTVATPQEVAELLFPELKESEDERIRKEIIQSIQDNMCVIHKDKCIAWLEKQSTPQVRTGIEWVKTIDDACEHRYAEEYAHGEYCHEQSFKWGFQEGVDWLEKQDSIGKINEKLRQYREYLVEETERWHKKEEDKTLSKIGKQDCIGHANAYVSARAEFEDLFNYDSWLEKQGEKTNKVSIWKHWKDGIAGNGDNVPIYLIKSGNTYMLSSCLGFECDYIELSELDKLYVEKQGEQKPADKVEPKFRVKYAGNKYNVLEIKDIAGVTYYGIEDEPNHIDYVLPENCEIVSDYGYGVKEKGSPYPTKSAMFSEQKPAWSEEDERMFTKIEEAIKSYYAPFSKDAEEMLNWFKSLKEKYTWKPSDEQMKALWDSIPENVKEISEREMLLDSLYQDLKKLRKE